MLSVAFVGVALAACGLPATIDPAGECVTDANGFSTLDADSDEDIPISLTISTKGETTDAFTVVHPATAGDLTDDTATDGRYVLACKQPAGFKTVMMTVTRPAELTAFGAEWVQLFPKDSWANTTSEYEPFTFNHYGAKIPLPEFRATPTGLEGGGDGAGLSLDAATAGVVNVFMEVKDEGDYEIRYGNPYLTSNKCTDTDYPYLTKLHSPAVICYSNPEYADGTTDCMADGTCTSGCSSWCCTDETCTASSCAVQQCKTTAAEDWLPSAHADSKWVAVEFKQTILRVGAPWADCTGSELAAPTYAVGAIMPLLFGGPNLNSVALKEGFPLSMFELQVRTDLFPTLT